VYDGGIVPGGTYNVRVIDDTCDCMDAAAYSGALTIQMSAVGDVVGDCSVTPCTAPQGVVDFVDISAVVDKFRNLPTAPRKSRADIINSDTFQADPDRKVDFVDISCVVDAFRNTPCALVGPPTTDPCPGLCP
jgi:hypothetical protein